MVLWDKVNLHTVYVTTKKKNKKKEAQPKLWHSLPQASCIMKLMEQVLLISNCILFN